MSKVFDHSFERSDRRYQDAIEILDVLLPYIPPVETSIDVGGGQGAWCKAMIEKNIQAKCIDHPDTLRQGLVIDETNFNGCDLAVNFPDVERCDLGICLEVAEHLPESRSQKLVKFLTDSSHYVLFSAAIPGQPGDNHINCQPPAYWRELFAEQGFQRYDIIRPQLIGKELPYWWKQNLFLYSDTQNLSSTSNWPSCHCDDIEFISDRMLKIYRDALITAQTPLLKRIKNKLLSRLQKLGHSK